MTHYTFDVYGRVRSITTAEELEAIREMSFPVRCRCGKVYDIGAVTVTARYADCSVWKTPCCRRVTDDRPAGWSSGPSYQELDKRTGQPR